MRRINPGTLASPSGYTHAIRTGPGALVHLSGQTGTDASGEIVADDLPTQFDRALGNLLEAARAAGAGPDDLVKATVFCTDLAGYRDLSSRLGRIWQDRAGRSYPALTCVEVSRLWDPRALVEIEALALVPDPRPQGDGPGGPLLPFAGARPRVAGSAFLAPGCVLVGDVEVGEQSSVWFGAVVRADQNRITIGARSNVQDTAVLHVDPSSMGGTPLVVGDGVTVGHGAVLHGCTVRDGALVGLRSTVMNGAVVGAGSVVAAGALVPPGSVVPDNSLVVGVPARAVRAVRPDERDGSAQAAATYVRLAEQYRAAAGRHPARDRAPEGRP